MQTVWIDETIVGSIAKFVMEDDTEITYWIDRIFFWEMELRFQLLKTFQQLERRDQKFGRVAFDNIGSQKVLEKCGFVKIGNDKGFANAREVETTEFIYMLT